MYQAERQPKAFPLGSDTTAECGGCLAEQVEGLYQMHLDHLELIGDLLTSRAELRQKLEIHERFGL